MQPEIEQIIGSGAKCVVIGGKSQIKNAMSQILKNRSILNVVSLNEKDVENSTGLGAIIILEFTQNRGNTRFLLHLYLLSNSDIVQRPLWSCVRLIPNSKNLVDISHPGLLEFP